MATSQGNQTLILTGPSNYLDWIHAVKSKAVQRDVWPYINPDLDDQTRLVLTEPIAPEATEFASPAVLATATERQSPVRYSELTSPQRTDYQFAFTQYQALLKTYQTKTKSIADIHDWVTSNISAKCRTYISRSVTLAEVLAKLKSRIQPTDQGHKLATIQTYARAKILAKNTKIEDWIDRWEDALEKATLLDLPEVQEDRPIYDFLEAIRPINPHFYQVYLSQLNDAEDQGTNHHLTGPILAKRFRSQYRQTKLLANHEGAAFEATLQGQKSPPRIEPENRGKKTTCLCGSTEHFKFELCPLVNQTKAGQAVQPEDQALFEQVIKKAQPVARAFRGAVDRLGNQATQWAKDLAATTQPPKEGRPMGAVAFNGTVSTYRSSFESTDALFDTGIHPLRNSFIYDSGANCHICNDLNRFDQATVNWLEIPEQIWSGAGTVDILAYGTAKIYPQTTEGKESFLLYNCAYAPQFTVNVVSARQLRKAKIFWSTKGNYLEFNGTKLFDLTEAYGQYVLEYKEVDQASFTSLKATASFVGSVDSTTWHLRMGHLGPEALEQLVKATTNARIKAPTTVDCTACAQAKAVNVVSRTPRGTAPEPFYRVHFDLFEHNVSYNGYRYALLFKDEYTAMIFAYFLPDKNQDSILEAVKALTALIKTQYDIDIKQFHTDNERALGTEWKNWIVEGGKIHRTTPSHTHEPNGQIERTGRLIKFKGTALALGANLPPELWPEVWGAAGYIYNRSPRRFHQGDLASWLTPHERLNQFLRSNGYTVEGPDRPDVSHLRAYGCRAYPLTHNVKAGLDRRSKLAPRAYVGYLVGYVGISIYKIWIPELAEVLITRDVTFNENQFYNPQDQRPANEIQQLEDLAGQLAIKQPDPPTASDEDDEVLSTIFVGGVENGQDTAHDGHDPDGHRIDPNEGNINDDESDGHRGNGHSSDGHSTDGHQEVQKDMDIDPGYPSPDPSPSRSPKPDQFRAGFFLGTTKPILRKDLPPEPTTWSDLKNHPYRAQFKEASRVEWNKVKSNSVKLVKIEQADGHTILPLKWVWKYKFDENDHLIKFKARICVRGDLQPHTGEDTYAATLAAKAFQINAACMAKYGLDSRSYDAVNAFTNSNLRDLVFTKMPPGFGLEGWIILLLRALYGLRISPLLWYQELAGFLRSLGLCQGTEESCIFFNDWLIIFFYVDDIVAIYRPEDNDKMDEFERKLMGKYEMKRLKELKWFLGIQIVRDLPSRKLWLSQHSYIDKIANLYNIHGTGRVATPLPSGTGSLDPYQGKATASQIHEYQRKMGSVTYPSCITRPDISYAVSKLAEHLTNPGPIHLQALDRLIIYLDDTRYRALEFDGYAEVDLLVASDASFADNNDRKSTQAYVVLLFGGLVAWRSNKQTIITGSTTEAELLSLTQATKEVMQLFRIFRDLQLDLGQDLTIYCDNQQTLRLVTTEGSKIKTALKHLDVPKLWLRQEYQRGAVKLRYLPTADMPADGLTKQLTKQQMQRFYRMVNLVDISPLI